MHYPLFISCPKNLEYLLEAEVKGLGLTVTRVSPQGVYGNATLETLYQLILWSRLANRIHLVLFSKPVPHPKAIYQETVNFPWERVFSVEKSLAIDFHGESEGIRNSMFGAQLIKDGVVDYFRKKTGTRPSIDKETPQIRLSAYLKKEVLTLSLDLCGYSLHQRGYRSLGGIAPLKENVASALLLRAGWDKLLQAGYSFQDPFCGVGTLVIEAAMMAANKAPGLVRQNQAIIHWNAHSSTLWEAAQRQAQAQEIPCFPIIEGSDKDPAMVDAALANAALAGVDHFVNFTVKPMEETRPPSKKGLIVTNPPYGERLGDVQDLIPLYQSLGKHWHQYYQGFETAVLTANPLLAKAIGLRARKQYAIFNGALACKVYCISLTKDNTLKEGSPSFPID